MVSLLTFHSPQNDDFRFARELNILHFSGMVSVYWIKRFRGKVNNERFED